MGGTDSGDWLRWLGSRAARGPDDSGRIDRGRSRGHRPARLQQPALGLAVAATVMLGYISPERVWAQGPVNGERPSALGLPPPAPGTVMIEVPSLILGLPASEASLGLRLIAPGGLPPNSYVRIRGLPPQVSLSDGHAIAPGAWAVPIAVLPDLRIVIPAGLSGRSEVTITLVGIDSGSIVEARTMLVVAGAALSGLAASPDSAQPVPAPAPTLTPEPAPQPRPAPPAPPTPPPAVSIAPAAPPPQPLPPVIAPPATAPQAVSPAPLPKAAAPALPPAKPPPSPEVLERARSFMARGQALLDGGDIASARLVFERAADAGLWEAALAIGTTYDATELARRRTVGVRPDNAEAKRWYERARDLGGGANAERYLARLMAR